MRGLMVVLMRASSVPVPITSAMMGPELDFVGQHGHGRELDPINSKSNHRCQQQPLGGRWQESANLG